MRTYIDSDILIWHLRGDPKALDFFHRILREESTELWIGALQRAEVVFFMRPNEMAETMHFLSQFRTAPVTQEVVDEVESFFANGNPRTGLM